MVDKITIASMNVRGLAMDQKRRDVLNWLKGKQYSIYCLQDVHWVEENRQIYKAEWGLEYVFCPFRNNCRGVAIMFNNNFEYEIHNSVIDEYGNYIVLDISIYKQKYTLVSVYGPNKDSPMFYQNLYEIVKSIGNASIIWCGDWNTVLNYNEDTHNYVHRNNPKAQKMISDIMDTEELVDVWRAQHPNTKRFTWQTKHRPFQKARLDFFLVTPDIHSRLLSSDIVAGYRTDHSMITISLDFGLFERGKGFWKFNVSLLQDENYVKLVKNCILSVIQQYNNPNYPYTEGNYDTCNFTIDFQTLLEMLKLEIRGKTIRYSSKLKHNLNNEINKLQAEINILQEQVDIYIAVPNERMEENLISKQERLENLRKPKIEGAMLRSRCQYYEDGEKPTKYFCGLEKRNYESKLINMLEIDGQYIRSETDILREQQIYYQTLYSDKHLENADNKLSQFLNDQNVIPLSNEARESCEGLITLEEIKDVLKNMKNSKTPGCDGFPVEFYKFFWNDISFFLLKCFNESYIKGQLSLTQRRGVITCIAKKDKPRQYLKNWRPITLLNVDYKILSGIIAKRMKSVLENIINKDQKGFLKNRYIGENIRLVYDLIAELQKHNMSKLILLIDFEKAFDSVSWKFINKVLRIYNFGDSFIKWFNILYNDAQSCVINNGKYSQLFPLGRGCRQGDPLSPYIFILAVEPLASAIRNAPDITGITIGRYEYKVGQYADDTFILLNGSEYSLKSTLHLLTSFGEVSGLCMNVDKTQAAWIGKITENNIHLCPELNLNWVENFTLLGFSLSNDLTESCESNYNKKLLDIEKILSVYKKRHLSLLGKITVIKTLAIPKLILPLTILPNPSRAFIKQVENIFKSFIWNDKRSKISLQRLSKDKLEGGLGLTNISVLNDALKITWVQKLIKDHENIGWQRLFKYNICKQKFLWELDITSLNAVKQQVKNNFWQNVITAWVKLKNCHFHQVPQEYPIWDAYFNMPYNIKIRKNELIQHGLVYVNDLLDINGNLLTNNQFQTNFTIHINYLDYQGLLSSIPKEWKDNISVHNVGKLKEVNVDMNWVSSYQHVCKKVYSILNDQVEVNEQCHQIWDNICRAETIPDTWKTRYQIIYLSTIESKMRSFQFKLIKRILPTNSFLFKCNIIAHDICTFCEMFPETLEHLFFYCKGTQLLWQQLCIWLQPCIELHNMITLEGVLFGHRLENNNMLINHILLIAKRFIYVQRCNNKDLALAALLKFIKKYFETEQSIVKHKAGYVCSIHKNKWNPIVDLLQSV